MDGGVWWATVHGVANSWTRLSDFIFFFFFHFYLLNWDWDRVLNHSLSVQFQMKMEISYLPPTRIIVMARWLAQCQSK